MVVTSRGIILRSAHIRVNSSSNRLNRGDNPKSDAGAITGQRTTYLLLVWSVWSCHAAMHTEEEQSTSDGILATYAFSSGLKSHSSIYVGAVFLSVRTTGFGLAGLEDSGVSLRYDNNNWTVRDSWTVGVVTRYLYSTKYFPCV